MRFTRKAVGVLVAGALVFGAGSAWAGGGDNPPAGNGPSTSSTKALGGGTTESVFVPIAPCRVIDTREAGGKLALGGSRVFDITGSGATFAAQGGKAGGCGIPDGSTAIEATITAVDSGSGFLRAWPANQTAPNATFLNYSDALNVSNTGTVGINGCTGVCLINTDLRLRAFGSDTHVVVDVNGYYSPPLAAVVSSGGALSRNSRAIEANRSAAGTYQVMFNRKVDGCVYHASVGTIDAGITTGYAYATNLGGQEDGVWVQTFDSTGALSDRAFHLTVTC